MKKRWLAAVLALCLLLSGCGGGNEPQPPAQPEPSAPGQSDVPAPKPEDGGQEKEEQGKVGEIVTDPALESLRAEIADSGCLLGVAYLGYAQLPGWADVCVYVEANGYADLYPFLTEIGEDHAVLQEGGEVYAVVPAEGVTLRVCDHGIEEEVGEELLSVTDGGPILLRGNVSDIVPNLHISARDEQGLTVDYLPCLSLMNGALNGGEGVYDFTPYELVMGIYPEDSYIIPVYSGIWYARHTDGSGELMAMTLELDGDGGAYYSYGPPDSEVYESFSGTWTEYCQADDPDDWRLELQLTGGPVFGEEEPYDLTCSFSWDARDSALFLRHREGSPLLWGSEGAEYCFLSFDGFRMVNNWTHRATWRNWYYDLQLMADGSCHYSIGEENVGQMVSYEGWWYLLDDVLSLSLVYCDGEHPENPEMEYLYGEYLVEDWQPTSMTLSYLSGEILTLDMEETTKASFFGY